MLAKIESYLLTAALCLAFGFGSGWKVHAWRVGAQQTHAVEKTAQKTIEAKDKQSQITAAVEGGHAAAQEQIRTVYRTIEKEVPVYVPPSVDRAFPLPVGFVRVLNAAALGVGVSQLPDPAGRPDDQASRLAASAGAAGVVANYELCTSTRQQLIDLQAWVNAQATGQIPKELSMVDWEKMVKDGEAEMVGGVLYKNRVEIGRLHKGQLIEADDEALAAADAAPVRVNPEAVVPPVPPAPAPIDETVAPEAEPKAKKPAADAAALLGD